MPLSNATITYDLSDLAGANFDARRTRVWATTNIPGGTIIDSVGNEIHLGITKGTVNSDGTGSISVVTPGTGSNPASWQTTIHVDYPNGRARAIRDFGPFTITADADLADLAVQQEVPPEYLSEVTQALDDYTAAASASATSAAASAALAQSVAGIATPDSLVASLVGNPASATMTALAARAARNILDYGVARGTTSSQTAAIKAALDAHPGEAFYFPPGDYRLDTGLVVSASNSLRIDGRLYAGAAMTTLLDYDNGLTVTNYAQDKFLIGAGVLDANLLASKALTVGSVIRFTLGAGLTIKDPINRGLVTKAAGAELIASNLRLLNTGTTNVVDNIAIENLMGDCHFDHIVIRDFTVGVDDSGSGSWDKLHPWIGTTAQLTARYPSSVGFINRNNSSIVVYYADTFRYDYRSAATSGFAYGDIRFMRSFTNTGNLTNALAAANPGAVFDLVDGGYLDVAGGRYDGHGVTPRAFVQGTTTRLNARKGRTRVGGVTGIAEWESGVQKSATTPNVGPYTRGTTTSFSPTVYGHTTAGSTTYTTQSGSMEVRDGIVWYRFRVTGTLGASAGNIRIGGFPFVPGATVVGTGHGPLIRAVGAGSAVGIVGANGTAAPLVGIPQTVAGAEVAATASTAFDIWGEIACPFTYPS